MKKAIGIIIFGLLLSSNAYATSWVNTTITNLVNDGYKLTHTVSANDKLYLFFENGNKQYEANFIDDKEEGLVNQYDENGVKTIEVQFVNGKQV